MTKAERVEAIRQMMEAGLLRIDYYDAPVEMVADEPDYQADVMRVRMRVESKVRVRWMG